MPNAYSRKARHVVVRNRAQKLREALRGFFIGAFLHDMMGELRGKALSSEYMLMLAVLGDMLGYPVSSYYRLRLLPYWMPRLEAWKHELLREKDITEKLH